MIVSRRRVPRLRLPLRALRRVLAGLALALALIGAAAASDPPRLPGADDPAFVSALALWLSDDEATALPALADLAAGGNVAARLLLGQIDKTPALQGPFLAQLPRAARIALLRAPGGMSGRSWFDALRGTPLAEAWSALRQPGGGPELIARFEALGEARAARQAMVVLAAREHPGLGAVDPATVPADLLYLLWRNAGPERRAAIAAMVPADNPEWQLMGQVMDARSVDRWLAASAAASPLAALCRAVCPESPEPCLSAGYGALASHDALLTLGSPAEALVPQEAFLASPRGRATVLRRMLLSSSMRARRAMLDRVGGQSQCLGAALLAEADRYRRVRTPGTRDGG